MMAGFVAMVQAVLIGCRGASISRVLDCSACRRSSWTAFALQCDTPAIAFDVHLEDRRVMDEPVDCGEGHVRVRKFHSPKGWLISRLNRSSLLIAAHPVLEGRHQRRVTPGHRKGGSGPRRRAADGTTLLRRAGDIVAQRSLEFYDAVARQLAQKGRT